MSACWDKVIESVGSRISNDNATIVIEGVDCSGTRVQVEHCHVICIRINALIIVWIYCLLFEQAAVAFLSLSAMRSAISPAALFKNVSSKIRRGSTPSLSRPSTRAVKVWVFPVPGPVQRSSQALQKWGVALKWVQPDAHEKLWLLGAAHQGVGLVHAAQQP